MHADGHSVADPDAYRAQVRDWLNANLPEGWRQDRATYRKPELADLIVWERNLYRAGFAGMAWPQQYGGQGLTIREHLIVNQEIGRLAMPVSVNSLGKELVGPILLAVGSEEQRNHYIPRLLDMQDIWCQGFSEPQAGSDLARLRTRAERTDSGWIVNGQKIWTSLADRADYCMLLARTGAADDRRGALGLFILPMKAKGVTARPIRQMTEAEGFCEVFFDNVELEADALIGSADGGWPAAVQVLSVERATNRMYRGWRFENEFDHLVRTCAVDPALKPLLADTHYRNRLAASRIDLEIVKRYACDVVDRIAEGGDIGQYGSFMKLHWSEAHQRFCTLGMEMLAKAWASERPETINGRTRFEELYLQGRAETIYAGTSEIQLGIIADRILKLPRAR